MSISIIGARRLRAARGALAAGALAFAVAGCGGIPASGPVIAGRELDEANVVDRSVLVRGPEPGDTPEEVVRGFLLAQAGFARDHDAARRYLVDGRRWRPDASVTIYPTSTPVSVTGPDAAPPPAVTPAGSPDAGEPAGPFAVPRERVVLSAPVVATVDGTGLYRPAEPNTRWLQELTLVRVGGQWRISDAPDGIALSEESFRFTFSQFPLYFPDLTGSFLVPDVRWFPLTRTATTTRLVRALLAGPSPWLAPSVTTGVPPNTRLAVAATVSNEVATIDLTPNALRASQRQQRHLVAQLRATLAPVPRVSQIRLTVRQAEFAAWAPDDSPSVGENPQSLRVEPPSDPRPLVLDDDGRVARVTSGEVTRVEGLEVLAVPGASMPASDANGTVFAVLADQRSRLLVAVPGAREATELVSSENLTAPSIDPKRWVWTAPAEGGVILAAAPGEQLQRLEAPWLNNQRVESVRVSRDGARLLVAATGSGRARLLVSGIQRHEDGTPEALGRPESLLPDLTAVLDAAWADQLHVVLLGTRAGQEGGPSPWSVLVGGSAEALPGVEGARTIAASSEDQTWVATSDGHVRQRSGAKWQPVGRGMWLTMPG